jgi:glycosyltransferase involved in cell wall biosynthesis
MPNERMISVIVPAFNAEGFISTALESIRSQEHDNLDVIVIDDGSTDCTAEICESFGGWVRCIRQKNSGLPAARNRGLAASRGAYISFLDADDIYEPGGLRIQYEKMMANQAVDLVIGRFLNEKLCRTNEDTKGFVPIDTPDEVMLSMSVSLVRRAVFERVGLFDTSLRYCDDWDWFMRAREMQVPMLFHREIVMRRRLHDRNMTRDRELGNAYMALMLKRSLDRRRAKFGEAKSLPKLSASLEPLPRQEKS